MLNTRFRIHRVLDSLATRNAIMRKIDQMINKAISRTLLLLLCAAVIACAPIVKVETPSEPITINLNIKLDADVRVKLADEAKKDIAANPGVF
jgi:hypothetical protein